MTRKSATKPIRPTRVAPKSTAKHQQSADRKPADRRKQRAKENKESHTTQPAKPTALPRDVPKPNTTLNDLSKPQTNLAATLKNSLRDAARSGGTLAFDEHFGQVGRDRKAIYRALAAIEPSNPADAPLLSALLVDGNRKVHLIFRDVLICLGYEYIPSDLGLS
jgi:hypothetical protein